jgi:hypothetical protein
MQARQDLEALLFSFLCSHFVIEQVWLRMQLCTRQFVHQQCPYRALPAVAHH